MSDIHSEYRMIQMQLVRMLQCSDLCWADKVDIADAMALTRIDYRSRLDELNMLADEDRGLPYGSTQTPSCIPVAKSE